MIGYYIHHHGTGHLNRAAIVAAHSDLDIVALSSLPEPDDHPFAGWVRLAGDPALDAPADPTAGGALHWAPLDSPRYRERMAVLAEWIDAARPTLLHVDVSVEVATLARLLGVPVSVTAQPGRRGDAAHQLGYALAVAILAPWPASAPALPHLRPHRDRTRYVGAFSRFDGAAAGAPQPGRVTALLGGGGSSAPPDLAAALAKADWDSWVFGGAHGWTSDARAEVAAAEVVVTHAGLNAIAEIAAARRPAVVVPEDRPFAEQHVTAEALTAGGLAVVCPRWPEADEWPALLARARDLGGARWTSWNDGLGAQRFAAALAEVA